MNKKNFVTLSESKVGDVNTLELEDGSKITVETSGVEE